MLRASVETEGAEVDYRGLADARSAEESTIVGAGALVGFVDAVLSDRSGETGADVDGARARVHRELGAGALVDAAAIIGNFERMTRIADSTGIPLDEPVNVMTESLRAELGIDAFRSAERRRSVKIWQRFIGRLLDPVVAIALRRQGERARAKADAARTRDQA